MADGAPPDEPPTRPLGGEPPTTLGDLVDELEALERTVDDPAERDAVERAKRVAGEMQEGRFGNVIVGFDRSDAAEALLGAVLFGLPMFVEGGTLEVGAFLADRPLALAGTLLAAVALTVGIIYVADFQDVRVHRPLLGILPRRLVGVLGIAAVTAAVAMTAWGRVDWAEPWLAAAQVTVAFLPMAVGAALGDLLPGS